HPFPYRGVRLAELRLAIGAPSGVDQGHFCHSAFLSELYGDRPVLVPLIRKACGVGRPPSPCTGNGPTALRPARTRARRPAEVVGINHAANPSEVATAFRTRSIGASIRIIRWIAGSISTLFSTVCPSSNRGLTASPAH